VSPRVPNESGTASAATTSARPFFGIDDVRQPRVACPRPPQQRERYAAAQETKPRPFHRHQLGALREAEYEHQIEEQLERLDRVALTRLGV
jgi:hypothetical protein